MKIAPKYLTSLEGKSYSYEGFQLPGFALSFGTVLHNANHIAYNLDESDLEFVAGVKLKEGEKIYRASTERTLIAGIKYLVKINLGRSLVYFLTEQAQANGEPIFETRGIQLSYLNIKTN